MGKMIGIMLDGHIVKFDYLEWRRRIRAGIFLINKCLRERQSNTATNYTE